MSEGKVPPTIHLMFPTGERTTCEITKDMTAATLIQRLMDDPNITHPANRTIALVYHGRILTGSEILAKLDTLNEFTVHVFYRAAPPPAAAPDAPSAAIASDLRGFDRLRRMNYEESEIEELRQNFHAMHGTLEASAEERMEAEEEWFPVIFNHENPLQDLQLPRRERRARRRRQEQAPLANAEDTGPAIHDVDCVSAPWLRVVIGLIFGTVLGVGALIFILISYSDPWFVVGLLAGCCANYAARYALGFDTA